MKTLYKIIGMLAFMLLSVPSQAADELIYGVKNEYTLMGLLGGGILLLFVCILTLAFMMAKVLPMMLKKQIRKENPSVA